VTREVRAADGRLWTVRREINWSKPGSVKEFENDVAAGQVAGVLMLAMAIFMVLVVIFWAPSGVVFPTWLRLMFFALLMLIPLQWVVSRPWTIVAETHEPITSPGEHWVGTVRGLMASRHQTSRIAKQLERHAVPDDGRGPLQPVS
jgi:hypothetical protein